MSRRLTSLRTAAVAGAIAATVTTSTAMAAAPAESTQVAAVEAMSMTSEQSADFEQDLLAYGVLAPQAKGQYSTMATTEDDVAEFTQRALEDWNMWDETREACLVSADSCTEYLKSNWIVQIVVGLASLIPGMPSYDTLVGYIGTAMHLLVVGIDPLLPE